MIAIFSFHTVKKPVVSGIFFDYLANDPKPLAAVESVSDVFVRRIVLLLKHVVQCPIRKTYAVAANKTRAYAGLIRL